MQPLIIAHRGASIEMPENTVDAFKRAIALGADYFECDIQETLDKVPVVIHDETLDRTTKQKGRVSAFTHQELALPTLDEALNLAKDKIGIIVELKEVKADVVLPILKAFRSSKPLTVASFSSVLLREMHGLDRLGIAEDSDTFHKHLKIGLNKFAIEKSLFKTIDFSQYKKTGATFFAWTVDKADEAKALVELGVDGIITNDPRIMLSAIRKIHKRCCSDPLAPHKGI